MKIHEFLNLFISSLKKNYLLVDVTIHEGKKIVHR